VSDCIFCRILKREIPSNIAHEDDLVTVIHDVNPAAPVHLLAIPRKHIENLNDVSEEDQALLGHIQMVIARLAKENGFADQGYRVTTNCGEGAGQVVMHLHYHILSGRHFEGF
jgi:histidine triad (HIT) family protein